MDVQRGVVELEDDLFFADLSKRISLLITEDDEDFQTRYPALSLQQDYRQSCRQPFLPSHPLAYEPSNRRETKGTGVFIPRSSLPRRKHHRSGRSKQGDRARAASTSPTSTTTTTTTCNNP